MSATCRVYVNTKGLDAPEDATALDAVRLHDATAAEQVESGRSLITDSRGLPIDAGTRVHGGAIYRVIAARSREAAPLSDT